MFNMETCCNDVLENGYHIHVPRIWCKKSIIVASGKMRKMRTGDFGDIFVGKLARPKADKTKNLYNIFSCWENLGISNQWNLRFLCNRRHRTLWTLAKKTKLGVCETSNQDHHMHHVHIPENCWVFSQAPGPAMYLCINVSNGDGLCLSTCALRCT